MRLAGRAGTRSQRRCVYAGAGAVPGCPPCSGLIFALNVYAGPCFVQENFAGCMPTLRLSTRYLSRPPPTGACNDATGSRAVAGYGLGLRRTRPASKRQNSPTTHGLVWSVSKLPPIRACSAAVGRYMTSATCARYDPPHRRGRRQSSSPPTAATTDCARACSQAAAGTRASGRSTPAIRRARPRSD
jgi:hypothetical protein